MNKFERGREYERLDHQVSQHLFLGWSCLVMGIIWFFFSIWDFKTRLYGTIGLLLFSGASLSLGYSGRKELRQWK